MTFSFYWHDYETWGTDPSVDRPSQFAGVRTDENLNIIGEPLVIYCKPVADILPHPEACLVTGITPQHAAHHGVHENAFIARIHAELSQAQTCGVGYNSIRFDDEVTRYSLYRNYFDPYEREWRNGNSRWDIIDMVRLCYALRPQGIEWPIVEGKPSFKLENLTAANGIGHTAAHDAYSDVEATIALAQLIKSKQPDLYNYVFQNRGKREAAKLIDVKNRKPLLHISSKFSSEHGCAGLIVPLAWHPTNKNAVIVYNLEVDPSPMRDLSAEQIRERVFTAQADLPEGQQRLPIKLVHLNKCPILAIPKLLDQQSAERLQIDKEKCEQHWHTLLTMEVEAKLEAMYRLENFESDGDPERMLYDGFLGDRDKRVMNDLRKADAEALAQQTFTFEDRRLNAMLLRYKARNFPQSLSPQERPEWQEFVRERLLHGGRNRLSLQALKQRLIELGQDYAGDSKGMEILHQLQLYADALAAEYGCSG